MAATVGKTPASASPAGMDIAIPADFETVTREHVAAGTFASEQDTVAAALKSYLDGVSMLRTLVEQAIEEDDRGEGSDGEALMGDLIAKTGARWSLSGCVRLMPTLNASPVRRRRPDRFLGGSDATRPFFPPDRTFVSWETGSLAAATRRRPTCRG